MKNILSIFIFIFCIGSTLDQSTFGANLPELSNRSRLNDVYFENSHLSNANTFTTFGQIRSGGLWKLSQIETYAVTRMGADTRTNLDASSQIYNDNYLFAGAGVDYLGITPGVRFSLQLGGSFDLSSKIHRSGLDYRLGFQTYHEIAWGNKKLINEIYSEALYYHRYSNLLSSVQFRTVYNIALWNLGSYKIELAPMITCMGAIDSAGLEYNRFAELRTGPRITFRGPVTLVFSPFYVYGARWERPTPLPNYQDFRVLISGYFAF